NPCPHTTPPSAHDAQLRSSSHSKEPRPLRPRRRRCWLLLALPRRATSLQADRRHCAVTIVVALAEPAAPRPASAHDAQHLHGGGGAASLRPRPRCLCGRDLDGTRPTSPPSSKPHRHGVVRSRRVLCPLRRPRSSSRSRTTLALLYSQCFIKYCI
ncbi:hypothetical protein BDA96_10G209800, partial [Sorghum bicolor]